MDTGYLIIIELILVLGAVLGFAFWELYKLRQSKEDDQKNPPPNDNKDKGAS